MTLTRTRGLREQSSVEMHCERYTPVTTLLGKVTAYWTTPKRSRLFHNLKPIVEFPIDERTWNNEAFRSVWEPPTGDSAKRIGDVYAASTTESERAIWPFMKERKP